MNLNEILSGLGGAGATGAALAFMIRRLVVANDEKNRDQSEKIEQLTNALHDLQVSVSVLNTKVENLTKSFDKLNRYGCEFHRNERED
jgi:hypothetical protein